MDFVSRRDQAKEYFSRNFCTTQSALCEMFNIGGTTAQRIMDEVIKETRLDVKYIVDPEHEIKGLDWQYNPEKEIQHLTVPRY